MNSHDEAEDPRRRILIQALSMGLFSTGVVGSDALAQSLFGSRPAKLPQGQSIYRVQGSATVNDKPATLETQVKPGDTIKTAKDSEMVFVVNSSAMIVRSNTTLIIESEKPAASATSLIISGLRMLTGALLSVSRSTPMRVTTRTATIGIRGTGFYLEADPEQSYFCTCYGLTDAASMAAPNDIETIAAKQHDRPVYILNNASGGKNIRNAPFINHTDAELTLIETLVGRVPPFLYGKDTYTAPRRTY
jgi:FecR protein